MTMQELIESANDLGPSSSAAAEYTERLDHLLVTVNEIMQARSDLDRMIGEGNLAMMRDNHANHGKFFVSLLSNYSADVLVNSVVWVFNAYRNHGFQETYWSAQLNAWLTALNEHLSPSSSQEVSVIYDWIIAHIPHLMKVSDSQK